MSKFIFLKSLPTILEPLKRLIDRKAQDVDWNENDPASPSYIKGRTHYKSIEFVTNMPETSIEFANNGGIYVGSYAIDTPISEGGTKIVVWDGVSYSCNVTFLEGALALGNTGLLSGENNTGEPFLIGFFPKNLSIEILTADTSATHTVGIFEESTVVHKIPEEYLPETGVGKKFTGDNGNGEIFNDYENNEASGWYAHAEGSSSKALGDYSHAENDQCTASGISSHAEGQQTTSSNHGSHSEGYLSFASGIGSHAEGWSVATGDYSHAEGSSEAIGGHSHAEGNSTKANADKSHAEGFWTIASSKYQHVQGKYNVEDAASKYAHIVGNGTGDSASKRSNAHTLDWDGNAWFKGDVYVGGTEQSQGEKLVKQSEIPNNSNIVNGEARGSLRTDFASEETTSYKLGLAAFSEGSSTKAAGDYSHSEGWYSTALGLASHAEGNNSHAYGDYAHAEGSSHAYGDYAHAEGDNVNAYGKYSHVQGYGTTSKGRCQDVIGEYNIIENNEGYVLDTSSSISSGSIDSVCYLINTDSEPVLDETTGYFTFTNLSLTQTTINMLTVGDKYLTEQITTNINKYYQLTSITSYMFSANIFKSRARTEDRSQYVHIVGNGVTGVRSNAHTLDWDGNAWFAGDVYVGSTSGTDKDEGSKKLITQAEVESYVSITEADIDEICGGALVSEVAY